jgi:hypothetical protein
VGSLLERFLPRFLQAVTAHKFELQVAFFVIALVTAVFPASRSHLMTLGDDVVARIIRVDPVRGSLQPRVTRRPTLGARQTAQYQDWFFLWQISAHRSLA